MAVQCPQCSTESNIDFGMAQCDSCQAVFYVNLDGSVSVSDGTSEEPMEAEPSLQTFHSVEDLHQSLHNNQAKPQKEVTTSANQDWAAQQSWDSNSDEPNWNSQPEEHPLDEFINFPQDEVDNGYPEQATQGESNEQELYHSDSMESVNEDNLDEQKFQFDSYSNEDELEDVNTAVNQYEDVESVSELGPQEEYLSPMEVESSSVSTLDNTPEAPTKSPKEYLQEVVDFGNSDKSQARHGILFYNLKIEGIDTSEERHALMDILSNRQLMLSVEDLIKEIEDGILVIESLNPVKASVIVSELEMSGMEVSWTQGAINE